MKCGHPDECVRYPHHYITGIWQNGVMMAKKSTHTLIKPRPNPFALF